MKTFYQLLINAMLVATKNNFVWFALTYWVYLETRNVISTSIVGGTFLVAAAVSGMWFGSLVDRHKKKQVMLLSNIATLVFFVLGFLLFIITKPDAFMHVTSPVLWLFIVILLVGTIFGNIYQIAIPTLVTTLVSANRRDKANGLFGTVMGISFAITSVASGIVLGFFGMYWVTAIAIALTVFPIIHLYFIRIDEGSDAKVNTSAADVERRNGMDIRGTIMVISGISGLFPLIFLTTFNNFLGGVFMALMDAYGLSLVSVQIWGLLWGFLSFGFILGGLYIAKYGLGKDPLKKLFKIYIILWINCIFFVIQPSIVLLSIGALVWMVFVPFIEATEQTVIQKVVPPERQGRVFGFAHSVEQAASPVTAFLIGPVAQYVFIPFMTTGAGVKLIGGWFGVGTGRGIALVFIMAGLAGLIVTIFAMRARSYKLLAKQYSKISG